MVLPALNGVALNPTIGIGIGLVSVDEDFLVDLTNLTDLVDLVEFSSSELIDQLLEIMNNEYLLINVPQIAQTFFYLTIKFHPLW